MTSQVKLRRVPSSRSVQSLKVQLMAAAYKQRVGERIRSARESKGWTQRDLAYALPGRVDGPAISRWERGMVMPQMDTLEALAQALDVDVGYFMVELPPTGARDESTPDPFGGDHAERIERELRELRERVEGYAALIDMQNSLLERQSEILDRVERSQHEIERSLSTQADAVRQMEAAAEMLRAVEPLPPAPLPETTETPRSAK